MYNAGKASDFIAVELVEGRIQYTLNLGYGPINIKNNAAESLADNKWHWVVIGRPSRYRHTLMVDGHLATATTRGDNYHLDLDGILHLGKSFYSSLDCADQFLKLKPTLHTLPPSLCESS